MVKEVLLTGLGYMKKRVTLVALVDQDLLIYEAFQFTDTAVEGHLNVRFKRVSVSLMMHCCDDGDDDDDDDWRTDFL